MHYFAVTAIVIEKKKRINGVFRAQCYSKFNAIFVILWLEHTWKIGANFKLFYLQVNKPIKTTPTFFVKLNRTIFSYCLLSHVLYK